MKRKGTAALAATLLLALAAGCSSNNNAEPSASSSGSPSASATSAGGGSPSAQASPTAGDTSKHLDLTVSIDDIQNYDDEFGKMLQDKFNVTLTAKPIESDDSLGLWASGQELPDMWVSTTFEDPYRFYNWLDQGIIRDIPYDLISKYPNVKKLVDGSKEVNAIKDMKGGKIWFIPRKGDARNNYMVADGARIWYREDWAKQLGLTPPTTIAEYLDFLKAIGHSGQKGAPTIGLLNGTNYVIAMYGIDPEGWVKEDGQWKPAYLSDRMIEPLKALRDLYDTKTLDNEWMITDTNSLLSKWGNGMGATMIRNGGDSYWYNRTHRTVAEGLDPKNNVNKPYKALDNVEVLPIPKAPDGQQYWLPTIESGGVEFRADVTDEELDRLLQMIDWSLTDEAVDWDLYGKEGLTYTVDSDGKYEPIIDSSTNQPIAVNSVMPSAWFVSVANWMNAEAFFNNKWAPAKADDPDAAEAAAGNEQLREEAIKWTGEYDKAIISSGDDYTARLLSTPSKDSIYAGYDWTSEINAIVAGSKPVEDMFADFKEKTMQKGMQKVIDEVTAAMAAQGK